MTGLLLSTLLGCRLAAACSVGPCIGHGLHPGSGSPQLLLPTNLPGIALDPLRRVFVQQRPRLDVDAFYLEGADGHRVNLTATRLQPDEGDGWGRRPAMTYASFNEPLRPGQTYRLREPSPPDVCGRQTGAVSLLTTSSSAPLPQSAPALTFETSSDPVLLFGSAECYQSHPLPAIRLTPVLDDVWVRWAPAVVETVFVDGEPYSNWSVESETNGFTPRMDPRVVFALCGEIGSGGGVEEGTHEIQLAFDLPGARRYLTNSVSVTFDCSEVRDEPAPDGSPDAGEDPNHDGGQGELATRDEAGGCRSTPSSASPLFALLGLVFARRRIITDREPD